MITKMKIVCSGILLAGILISSTFVNDAPPKSSSAGGFALIELFTSEGCSSCPPADRLIEKVLKEHNFNVYILAYHVDYWNRQGWKDAFSSPQYSQRQRQYARWFKTNSLYTPQIVVNGQKGLQGANEPALRAAIQSGIMAPVVADLVIDQVKRDHDQVQFKYQLKGALKPGKLNFALIQKYARTKVLAGENSGRSLAHVNIVRKIQAVDVSQQHRSGTLIIQVPAEFKPEKWEIIAFLQETGRGKVLGIEKIPVQ
jgi:hypothetical protein